MSSDNPLLLAPIFIHVFCGLVALALWRFNLYQRIIGVLSGLLALGCTAALSMQVAADGVQVYRLGGWQPPYGIALVADGLTVFFSLMVGIVVLAAMVYTYSCREKSMLRNAYMPLALMQLAKRDMAQNRLAQAEEKGLRQIIRACQCHLRDITYRRFRLSNYLIRCWV